MRLAAVLLFAVLLTAQLTTGIVEGTVHNWQGRPASQLAFLIAGSTGFQIIVQTDSQGKFTISLPYGRYAFASRSQDKATAVIQEVEPQRSLSVSLVVDRSGSLRKSLPQQTSSLEQPKSFGLWEESTHDTTFPQGFSLQSIVLSGEPGSMAVPLDFTGLADNRLALISNRALSWTTTQFKLQGLDVTDSYQPGRPVMLPDVDAIAEVGVRAGSALTTSDSYGNEVTAFFEGADTSWHGAISTFGSGAGLASSNLPQPHGLIQQPEHFHWFTRDRFEIGGPVAPWADVFASVGGQWASRTVELAAPGQDQNSRSLFGTTRGDIRAGSHDRFDAEYTGSRLQISDFGLPAGIEALTSRRMSPEFEQPDGFANQAEADSFHFLQVEWTHQHVAGALQVSYGYSAAQLHTWTGTLVTPNQSRIELLGSTVMGAPPIENRATRPRHEVASAWQPGATNTGKFRHQFTIGGNWELSIPRNQMTAPSDLNLITAAGVSAFVVEYNTPVESIERVNHAAAYAADHLWVSNELSLDLGILADVSRGSLPAQSSPAGSFTSARNYPASGNLIAWNNVSPRAGFSLQVPRLSRLLLHGGYLRLYSPLAGRYLDYGNPNSLGGSVYQWTDRNKDGWFQPDELGPLVLRFGGPYSSIPSALQRPYSDEFDVGAQFSITPRTVASIGLFRRDEKHRIAAIDSGLAANAFTPVPILDPGPDGIPGTFDDQHLIVYQQNSATFGKDQYVLTNPPGLRELNVGLAAAFRTEWRGLLLGAAFTAEKAWGPTNPGNAVFENDPDVIGTLFIDPNSANPTLARSYVDRAYLGKIHATYRLPPLLGGLELASIANYLDGLPFARELLISGLAQGPFLVPTTVRGSPEGGNRAQFVLNWNLRIQRELQLKPGRLVASVDILNVTNSGQAIQQSDLTGTSFNLRLPVAIQPARFVRLGLTFTF